MTITDSFGRQLPSGTYARWASDNTGKQEAELTTSRTAKHASKA